jgi:hypothetical protein
MKGWKPRDGFIYSDGKKNYHKWVATVPKGVVNGSYEFTSLEGRSVHKANLNGASGYHDHNYGTLPLSSTTDGWYWGRAQIGDKTIIYAKVFGKAKPAFLGDFGYKINPESSLMFIGTEKEVLVDSEDIVFNDFSYVTSRLTRDLQNKVTLSNGMSVPRNYRLHAKGLKNQFYQVDVTPSTPLALSVPYYSRQGGEITLCERATFDNSASCESSPILISEQMDFPRYLQLVLKLPKPWPRAR